METDDPDDNTSEDEGGGPAAENGWSREDGVDGMGSSVDSDNGGCSTAGSSGAAVGWSFLLAGIGVFGRRRSAL